MTRTDVGVSDRSRLRKLLPAVLRPMGTAMAADRARLYVSTGRAGTVCVLETASGKLLHTIAVGKRPWGLGLSPDGNPAWPKNRHRN
jgi:YVTN family beta-propeller protein